MEKGKKKSFRYSIEQNLHLICIPCVLRHPIWHHEYHNSRNRATLVPFLSTTGEVLNRETSRNNCRCGFAAVLRPVNYIASHQQIFLHSFFTFSLPVHHRLGDPSLTKRQHFSSFSPFRIYTNLYFFPVEKKTNDADLRFET